MAHLLKETNHLASELKALQSCFEELSEEVYHSKGAEGENENKRALKKGKKRNSAFGSNKPDFSVFRSRFPTGTGKEKEKKRKKEKGK